MMDKLKRFNLCKLLFLVIFLHDIAEFEASGKAQFPFGYYGTGFPHPVGPPIRHYLYNLPIRQHPASFSGQISNPLLQSSSSGFHQQQIVVLPDSPQESQSGIRKDTRFGYGTPFIIHGSVFPLRLSNLVQGPYNPVFPFFAATVIPAVNPGADTQENPQTELDPEFSAQRLTSLRDGSCSYFNQKGVCYSASDCRQRSGTLGTYCRDVTKFCCIFKWKCNQSSKEETGYFVNERHPLSSKLTGTCSHTVTKMNSDICVVRVTPKRLTLPASIGFCEDLNFSVSGVPGTNFEPLCGQLNGQSFDVDVSSTNSITLKMSTKQSISLTWNIMIQQIPCQEASSSTWPIKGAAAIGPRPPQQSPPEQPKPEPSPPGTSAGGTSMPLPFGQSGRSVCGIANQRNRFSARQLGEVLNPESRILDPESRILGLQEFLYPNFGIGSRTQIKYDREDEEEDDEESETRKGMSKGGNSECSEDDKLRSGCSPDADDDTLLKSLEWDVPVLNDSLLYKYRGSPLPADSRITYGEITKPHEFPWSIAMYNNGRFHCGASLLSERHVLTAAHCVIKYRRNPARLRLSVGDWNINTKTDGINIRADIEKIVTHPGYSTLTLKYDLAVLTLKEKVKFTDKVRPICLPATDDNLEGTVITVTGWGRNENNVLQPKLMKHSAAVVSNKLCNNRWEEKGSPKNIIADTMLCMDPYDGDSCKGDSGGPAILEDPPNSGRYVQVGIVSFGSASCTDKRLPGVYTRVSKVKDWIRSQMV